MNRSFTMLSFTSILFGVAILIMILYSDFDIILNRQFVYLRDRIVALKRFLLGNYDWENFVNKNALPKATLNNLLDKYNSRLKKKKITDINQHISYGKGSFTDNITEETDDVIHKVINNINLIGDFNFQFLETERIEKIVDSDNNTQFIIQLFVHDVLTSVSVKLVLNYYKNYNGEININSLKKESQTLKDNNNFKSTINRKQENIYKTFDLIGSLEPEQASDNINYGAPIAKIPIFDNDKVKENNTNILNEPCKYNLNLWDNKGVHAQFKLADSCNITNNTHILPKKKLIKNPTMFSHNFINPSKTYYKS